MDVLMLLPDAVRKVDKLKLLYILCICNSTSMSESENSKLIQNQEVS